MNSFCKYLFVFMAVGLISVSCERDEPYSESEDGKTRYTVIGAVPQMASSLIASATVYEYNSGDIRIDSNVISNPCSGTQYVFESNKESTHLKIKLISKENTYRWGDTIVMLKPRHNVTIKISITSPTAMNEPKL